MQFKVSSQWPLGCSLIAGFLRQQYPGAEVTEVPFDDAFALDGVRVEIPPSPGWLFIARERPTGAELALALRAGACVVITLQDGLDELANGTRSLLDPSAVRLSFSASASIAGAAIRAHGAPDPYAAGGGPRLTEREGEVLAHVASGLTNQQIASAMRISVNTVRTHLHAVAMKLDCADRGAMAECARQLGLLAEDDEQPGSRDDHDAAASIVELRQRLG